MGTRATIRASTALIDANMIRLIATDGDGDGIISDHGDLADARLSCGT
ncbi:hypothetical protein ACFRI7_12620 [Streptomyces sp. NPDC056716]